jgi:hypothetical protein
MYCETLVRLFKEIVTSGKVKATVLSLYPPGKGKAIPLQAWTGPEVSRRMRLPDFKTIGT